MVERKSINVKNRREKYEKAGKVKERNKATTDDRELKNWIGKEER